MNWCKNCQIETEEEDCPKCGEYIEGERMPNEDEPDCMDIAHAEAEENHLQGRS